MNEWDGLWTEDSQNGWDRLNQRAVEGSYSAEVDGKVSNAKLTSIPINLEGRTNVTITFSWHIEATVDQGEYLAFDVKTDGGKWTEKARLSGKIDEEKVWHNKSFNLVGINSLQIRFRGRMSESNEEGNVDMVQVSAW